MGIGIIPTFETLEIKSGEILFLKQWDVLHWLAIMLNSNKLYYALYINIITGFDDENQSFVARFHWFPDWK